ncbi:MAG: CRTAC1 family protein [Planctomycetia bacterium]|nr:CRTAC1 family protein [Planctomycetia bacterium]
MTATSIDARPPDMLYRGLKEGGFVAVGEQARIDDGDYSQGIAIADFDNDGFDDVYLTTIRHNSLFRNQGDGTFQNVTDTAGVDDPRWSSSAAWGDLDLDGDLDLYVCNYVDFDVEHPKICRRLKTDLPSMCHPRDFNPLPDECFENLGDGTFRQVAKSWKLEGPGNRALGVAIADYNNDGWPDIFVANDITANFLFLNRQQQQFEESATLLGCALSSTGVAQANMGIAIGDYDRNGYLDLYVTHFSGEWNTLYRNLGAEGFQDRTALLGLVGPTMPKLGFGTVMADFDQNGDNELFVANGHVDSTSTEGDGYEMVAQLFTKNGSRFEECGQNASDYFHHKFVGRGVALGDFDADGDWDLAVVHQNAPAAILRNDSSRGRWIKIQGIGRTSSRTPIGMRVTLKQGDLTLMQEFVGGSSYCSANESALIFGVGDSSGPCDLEIRWARGTIQHLKHVSLNQTLKLLEPIE